MKMKKISNMFKYSAETRDYVIARANTIEDVENLARRIMKVKNINEVAICTNNGCTLVKWMAL